MRLMLIIDAIFGGAYIVDVGLPKARDMFLQGFVYLCLLGLFSDPERQFGDQVIIFGTQ